MTLLIWQLGGLVFAVLAVIVVRELTRPRPLYLPPIANTKPPTVAELSASNPSAYPDTPPDVNQA